MPTGEHERPQRLELGVEPVDLALEPLGLRIDDGQPLAARPLGLVWGAQIRAEVEQIVLDARQHRVRFRIRAGMEARETDHGIELVDRPVSGNAQIVFAPARAAAERGRPVVSGAGVDSIQDDHAALGRRQPLSGPAPRW